MRASDPNLRRKSTAATPPEGTRSGVVVLEFILWAPVFVILLFALVEFALIWINLQQVKAASYAGAKVASELSNSQMGSINPANNIVLVDNAVSRVLASAGMARCEVIMETNPTCFPLPVPTRSAGACPAGCNHPPTLLPTAATIPGGVVRVTVCADISQLTPNFLGSFGFPVSNRTAKMSTLLPYENCH